MMVYLPEWQRQLIGLGGGVALVHVLVAISVGALLVRSLVPIAN